MVQHPPGSTSAQVFSLWLNAHPAKVEAMCVLAATDGRFGGGVTIRMVGACIAEQVELGIVQVEQVGSPHAGGQLCPTESMVWDRVLVLPLGVMEQGKEVHHLLVSPGVALVSCRPTLLTLSQWRGPCSLSLGSS